MAQSEDVADVGYEWLQRGAQYAIDVRDKYLRNKRKRELKHFHVCKYVVLAVKRWFSDLSTGHQRGIYFDEEAAARFFRFAGNHCRHYIGDLEGQLIDLEPWQCFIEMNIHGWMRSDGTRRFRVVTEEISRKNGKSMRLSIAGDYYLIADKEAGAQVYIAATKREQTKEIFDASAAIIEQDKRLRNATKIVRNKIQYKRGFIGTLSRDAKAMDGFNTHAALVDELHAHPSSAIWDVLRSSMGARKQPMMRGITTAGFDRQCFAYQQRNYAIKLLEGSAPNNDSVFAIIFTVDDEKKWDDETEWIKANPNLGVSVSLDDMREQYQVARDMPISKVEFLTKRLNIWTYGSAAWMNMERWDACNDPESNGSGTFDDLLSDERYLHADCWAGLDLSSTEDLTSLSLCFPRDTDRIVFQRSYLPQAALERRLKDGDMTFEGFKDSGHLMVIPGETVDYDFIKEDIKCIAEAFNLLGVAYDRWNSSQLVNDLISIELPMIKFGQGSASMSAPMKDLMRLVLTGKIKHNDPLLSFAVSNVVATINPAGDIKPDKSKVSEKIDPAVAMIMALALAMMPVEEEPEPSITLI